MSDKQLTVAVPVELLQAILAYLITRPYAEVSSGANAIEELLG